MRGHVNKHDSSRRKCINSARNIGKLGTWWKSAGEYSIFFQSTTSRSSWIRPLFLKFYLATSTIIWLVGILQSLPVLTNAFYAHRMNCIISYSHYTYWDFTHTHEENSMNHQNNPIWPVYLPNPIIRIASSEKLQFSVDNLLSLLVFKK